jgi:hypothetical protein
MYLRLRSGVSVIQLVALEVVVVDGLGRCRMLVGSEKVSNKAGGNKAGVREIKNLR